MGKHLVRCRLDNKFILNITIFVLTRCHQNHGTIIRTGTTCKKIPLQKSIEFGMALK